MRKENALSFDVVSSHLVGVVVFVPEVNLPKRSPRG